MALHRLQCRCGRLAGDVDPTAPVNRCTCYCKSCQAFPLFLDADWVLDQRGGTDIVQTAPHAVRITSGREHLACLRLTSNGTMRWYAACCGTPIGNTVMNYRVSFVGLIHACLADPKHSLDESFGRSRGGVFTQYAAGDPKPRAMNRLPMVWRLSNMMLRALVTGDYKRTPFYSPDGIPVVEPKVLTNDELREVMADVERRTGSQAAAR